VGQHRNPYADLLLVHFYRWMCSPQSGLFEPALHKLIHGIMKKARPAVGVGELMEWR
jgi:DNA polymerase epsilon subunit 1